jgi:hypothetical protein
MCSSGVEEEREVLLKAGLSDEADPENYLGGSSVTMYYIGLDVHKKTISYCVKDAAGCVYGEGKIGSTRRELDAWVRTLPQPRMIAMEATIFTGWIYDHLLPLFDYLSWFDQSPLPINRATRHLAITRKDPALTGSFLWCVLRCGWEALG